MKIVKVCAERVFWLLIFLSPIITGTVIALFFIVEGHPILGYAIIAAAVAGGFMLAEWIRKHGGCQRYLSELFHHK